MSTKQNKYGFFNPQSPNYLVIVSIKHFSSRITAIRKRHVKRLLYNLKESVLTMRKCCFDLRSYFSSEKFGRFTIIHYLCKDERYVYVVVLKFALLYTLDLIAYEKSIVSHFSSMLLYTVMGK